MKLNFKVKIQYNQSVYKYQVSGCAYDLILNGLRRISADLFYFMILPKAAA